MDFSTVMQAIGTLGFPIAMCVAMFWYVTKQTERHKEEISMITEALNNNTNALTRLEMKIGDDDNAYSSKQK